MNGRVYSLLGYLALAGERRAVFALVVLFAAFLALSLTARSADLLAFDTTVTRAAQQMRTEKLDRLAASFTFLGNSATISVIGAVSAVVFALWKRPLAGILCLASLLTLVINMGLKEIVRRPRPDADAVEVLLPVIGLSYPSGHAMVAVTFYGFLAFMAWVLVQRRAFRNGFVALFASIAILVAMSRVYVGAHWLSDILGGASAGLLCLLLLAETYRRVGRRELAPRPDSLGAAGSPGAHQS